MVPALGLEPADIDRLAEFAGVAVRSYSLGMTVAADVLCEVLFPPSARHRRAIGHHDEFAEWWWAGWPPV